MTQSQQDFTCSLKVQGRKSIFFHILRIDHANHENDPVGASKDALQYDQAWKIASDFAIKHGNTALVSGISL
jgi:hypothetical protein